MTPDLESPLASATGAHLAPHTQMGRLVAAHDWSATPLGPIDTWPETLATAVGICLSSRIPMLVCWGPDLTMVYNDDYLELLGQVKHADALGQPVAHVWPEIWDVIEPMFAGVMAGGPATWSEDQRLDVDRRGFPEEAFFTWTYGPIHGPDGTVEGVLNVAVETTDKVLAVRRAGVAAALVADLARAEDVAEVRAAVSNTMGADPADHLSVDLVVVGEARLEDLDAGTEGLDRSDGGGGWGLRRIPVREPGRDDLAGYLVVEPNPMRPWDESLQRHVLTCATHVATALRGLDRLEHERQRARALADLDAAKSTFFANVSHELRTPLTLISGPAHDALEDVGTPLPDVHRERVALIDRNSRRLISLVDRLLDLTRLEAGAVSPHPSETDVSAVTRALAAGFRPAIARAGLQFSESCATLTSPAFIDAEMFERIVLNLLSNAVKFTTEGSISIGLGPTQGGFEVSVSDTGVGIAAADVERIFERFQQLAPATGSSRGGGAGIGLSLTRELVELMGGRISVESELGVGSTFRVELPLTMPVPQAGLRTGQSISKRSLESFVDEVTLQLAAADASADLAPPATSVAPPRPPQRPVPGPPTAGTPAASTAASTAASKPRLLIVEDHPELRSYLADALADDYEVTTAADGLQGLALARTRCPDLVLADVMMPRLDGNGLVRELRAQPTTADVPVVLLSAHAGAEARVSGLEGGADDYLVKPFDLAELRARLVAVLRRPAQREQEARKRRDRAAAFASELAAAVDLEQVVVAAVAGFSVLFDGTATVRVTGGEADLLFTPDGVEDPESLPGGIREMLSLRAQRTHRRTDPESAVADQSRTGLLLAPSSAASTCRVWVQFRAVRPVSVDEEIVGDLLARSFAHAVDRVMVRQDREAKERQLQQAIESHRFIGQAVGVLIERHKVTAVEGFEMLRQASLQRNIKLREIANRVVETGQEPMQA